jgi:hypothetical protein
MNQIKIAYGKTSSRLIGIIRLRFAMIAGIATVRFDIQLQRGPH